jgi:hypothetical protein
VIGVLPQAFRHARLGYVDALIMYKQLVPLALFTPATNALYS